MPTYDFINTKTKRRFTKIMKIAEKEQYLKDNPHIQSELSPTAIHGFDTFRPGKDKGFQEVLKNIHQRTPGSQLDKTTEI